MRILENYSLIQRSSKSYWNVHSLVHTWTLFSKQHPQLNGIDQRAHLALTIIGRMLDEDVEMESPSMQQIQTKVSNHIESCIRTATNHTNALDLNHLSILPASTLLRVRSLFGDEFQNVNSKTQNMNTKLALLTLINGSRREGLNDLSTLQTLNQIVCCLMITSDYRLKGPESLMQISVQLLDKAVTRDTIVDVVKERLKFLAFRCCQIDFFGNFAHAMKAVEQSLIYSNDQRDELSDATRLRLEVAFMIVMTYRANEEVAAKALVPVEEYIHECDNVFGPAHKTTVHARVCKGMCLRALGKLEEAETLAASQVTLCQAFPANITQPLLLLS